MTIQTKQIASLVISFVFLGATVFLLITYFGGGGQESIHQIPLVAEQPSETKNLLPYGPELNFDALKKYHQGVTEPFPYPVVTPSEVGITVPDIIRVTPQE